MIRSYIQVLKELLTPTEILEKVQDIDLDKLSLDGYDTILLDVDNTIVARSEKLASLDYINWIQTAKSKGFRLFIVSNNLFKHRIKRICEQLDVPGIFFSMKPLTFSTRDLAQKNNIDFKTTLIVGDQVLTDILLANWLRTYSILVEPMAKNLSFIKTVQREVELFILKKLK